MSENKPIKMWAVHRLPSGEIMGAIDNRQKASEMNGDIPTEPVYVFKEKDLEVINPPTDPGVEGRVSDKIDRCGVGFFSLSASHPFTDACIWHDQMYALREEGKIDKSHNWVDNRFLEKMLAASNSWWLKAQAYTFWLIAKSPIGNYFWRTK